MAPILEVVPYRFEWQDQFSAAAAQLLPVFGKRLVGIHHIGSTSIAGICAKPIIDMLVEVQDISFVDNQDAAMEVLGYEVKGEYGIVGRRYFRKNDERGRRTHHLHVFGAGSSEVVRHLGFRDFMMAHPLWAQRYSELKMRLATEFAHSPKHYISGKDSFIKHIDHLAAQMPLKKRM